MKLMLICRCVEKSTGEVFAAKFVPVHQEGEAWTVRNEIRLVVWLAGTFYKYSQTTRTMSDLRHPALISLHDAFETEQEVVMVYEVRNFVDYFADWHRLVAANADHYHWISWGCVHGYNFQSRSRL